MWRWLKAFLGRVAGIARRQPHEVAVGPEEVDRTEDLACDVGVQTEQERGLSASGHLAKHYDLASTSETVESRTQRRVTGKQKAKQSQGQRKFEGVPQPRKEKRRPAGQSKPDPVQAHKPLRDELQRHDMEVLQLQAEAEKRFKSVAPMVTAKLRSLRIELQDGILTGAATSRMYELIQRVSKQRKLLISEEKARWGRAAKKHPRKGSTARGAGAKDSRSPEPPQHPHMWHWRQMEDPGQGGHRDLTRD